MGLLEAKLRYHEPSGVIDLKKKIRALDKLFSKSNFKIRDKATLLHIDRYEWYVEGEYKNRYDISVSYGGDIHISYERAVLNQPDDIAVKELESLRKIIKKAFKEKKKSK